MVTTKLVSVKLSTVKQVPLIAIESPIVSPLVKSAGHETVSLIVYLCLSIFLI